ncbi:MAG: GtrA family protein [Proteobacteria bacterium]|nr:GtrA family protein [Pseudomonadota bacterium]
MILTLICDPKLYQYMMVGAVAAIVDISLFFLFAQFLSYHYLILATMSFFIATLVNYLLCHFVVFTFAQARAAKTQILLTYFVSGIGLSIHHASLFVAIEFLGLTVILGKILAMGIAFGWNFLSRKHLVFKPAH